MELQQLKASLRDGAGTGIARETRRGGDVPGIVYGGGADPVNIRLDQREFVSLLHGKRGEHAVVQLEVDGKPDLNTPAVIKEVQHHPVIGTVIHADFQRIRLDEKIITPVAVALQGQPVGVVDGGILDHQLREVEVECLATSIPEELPVDVTGLAIGDSVHVSDLVAPEGVEILTDSARTLAAVLVSRITKAAEEEEAAAEEAAAAAEGGEAAAGDDSKEGESS
jgi:large subunit ribosomal protein L25